MLEHRDNVAKEKAKQRQDDGQQGTIKQCTLLKQPLAVGPKMIWIKPHDEEIRRAISKSS
jgi:hypothetical protein